MTGQCPEIWGEMNEKMSATGGKKKKEKKKNLKEVSLKTCSQTRVNHEHSLLAILLQVCS